ncbi:MAG: S46 family peptidase [Bacteroidota bacterium]
MHNTGAPSLLSSCISILLLSFFWGCSSPASIQDDSSESKPTDGQTERAEKTSDLSPGEGLWLVSQLSDSTSDILQSQDLQLPADSIYKDNGSSLSNAVLKIEGTDNSRGTGAFVSDRGLILTNYRTALSGIANAGTLKQQYLQNGFSSQTIQQEIPLKDYQLFIPIEQKDVTGEINSQLADSLTYQQKKRQAQNIKEQLITERKADNNNLVIEIDAAWGGNKYIMSVYKKIEDVRLVYAPPESTAFPSEDGYLQRWPSYSADYTFLRAYTDSSGNSQSYNKSNIPYQPKNHLEIDPSGVEANDQTLTLGYPDETHRQESSYAIQFYEEHRNPILIESYKAILNAAEIAARSDSTIALNNAPKRMMATQNLTYYTYLQSSFNNDSTKARKAKLEQEFSEWIKQDSLRNTTYQRVLPQLDQAYRIASQNGSLLFGLVQTFNHSKLLQIAGHYNSYYRHISDTTNPDLSRGDKQRLVNQHKTLLSDINIEAETQLLADMLYMLSTLPDGQVIFHLLEVFGDSSDEAQKNKIESYLKKQQKKSIVFNPQKAAEFMRLPADSALSHPTDEIVKLYQELLESYQFSRENYAQHAPYLEPAQELYVQGMIEFGDGFLPYPDANGTLRLSLGEVKELPQKDKETLPALSVSSNRIVNFISTNDISGGGYGSPVLNNNGKLVGLTSYRTAEGMGSDFMFDPKLHRSINVDIRYILSLTTEFSSNERLFEEMGISKIYDSTNE